VQPAAVAPSSAREMRVLIVDDEPAVRRLVANMLKQAGTCEMAGTAAEALDRLAREHFDIGLIDIGLPETDGLTLARRIEERYPDMALVFVTGLASFEAAVSAMQVGAVDYLVKPFTAASLNRAFERAVERRRVRLDAARALGFQQVIAERTVEINLLLMRSGDSADALVASFLAGLRLRHPLAAAHAERVAALSRQIAAEMRIPSEEIEVAERVGVLHDLGKVALPDALLFSTDPLSPTEVQLVRRHPEFGHDVLRRVPALADCAEPVLSQLEHFDGSGTPVGLRGRRIPQAARVVAVANVYDVMTHERPHAPLQSQAEALRELSLCSGTQYDPDVLGAFFALMQYTPPRDEWDTTRDF
jgi:putative two-component system response regulator